MIVVKVELWPGGSSARMREIGRVFIANSTPDETNCDYFVKAEQIGQQQLSPTYDEFVVKGHNRNQLVFALLAKVFANFMEPQKTSH